MQEYSWELALKQMNSNSLNLKKLLHGRGSLNRREERNRTMTEREKAFEKARKIYALVQEGVDGEKESARVAFERICRAHGFGEDDFNDEIIG